MNKYIDAEKLKTKVKKLNLVTKTYEEQVVFNNALAMVVEIIDSLQQEQTLTDCNELQEPEVDLEKEIKRYIPRDQCPVPDLMEAVARHFAEWQEKQDLRWAAEIHKNGYNLCKEQMLKDAVVAYVNIYENVPGGSYVELVADISAAHFKKKEGVKILILREDKE